MINGYVRIDALYDALMLSTCLTDGWNSDESQRNQKKWRKRVPINAKKFFFTDKQKNSRIHLNTEERK
jgi:hypothetical protein